MDIFNKKLDRLQFTVTYCGALAIKVGAAIVVGGLFLRSDPALSIVMPVFVWVLIDLCLLPIYASRLNDVSVSLYCLLLIYASDLYLIVGGLSKLSGHSASDQVLDTTLRGEMLNVLGILCMVGLFIRIFLMTKAGEPDEVS